MEAHTEVTVWAGITYEWYPEALWGKGIWEDAKISSILLSHLQTRVLV